MVSGSVFGISNTAVTPPITALRDPVSRSSLWVWPGSRECTWVSITPGRMCRPLQSIVSPGGARPRALDRLAGGGLSEAADRRDPAIGDADVADTLAVLIDHGAGF